MKIEQVRSQRIRAILSGSCTPAIEIKSIKDKTKEEWQDIRSYFNSYVNGGLYAAARMESNHQKALDC